MPSKRGVAIFGVRAFVGIVGIAVGVAAVSAAAFVSWPIVEKSPPSAVVSPQPGEQQRVCAGPLLTLAEDSAQASAATSVGAAVSVSGGRASATDADIIVRPGVTDLSAVDNADAAADGSPLLLSVPVAAGATTAPLVAGSQSQTVAGDTIGGLAVSACTEAVSDAWLVGGSTDIGNTSLVLLSNPSTVLATVSLSVFSETGAVEAPGSSGILVQPGAQRIVSLAGLAPNLKSPIVHVQSQGGQVAASLEQSVVHGLQPGGVELIGPAAPAAPAQTIPGVIVATPPPAAGIDGDFSDATSTVRILVPGDLPATVQVGLESESGTAAGTSLQVTLQPGIATEVPLDGPAAGSFTVRLASDQPIVAAARTATIGASGTDFAWFAASGALAGDFMVAVAAGPAPTLHLHNPATTDAALTVSSDEAASVGVTVPAGQSVVVPLTPSARYTVTGGTRIVASVGYSGDGLLSSFPVSPSGPLATPITVYAH